MCLKIRSVLFAVSFFCLALSFMPPQLAAATLMVRPENTSIDASIRYSVIGKYHAEFEDFQGEILFDPASQKIRSVRLIFKTASITSNCSWCDDIVRSKRLLHAEKFTDIVFEGSAITRQGEQYVVRGQLDLHGVVKELDFVFDYDMSREDPSGLVRIRAQGDWEIDRKDFGITWNKVLDQGGILVGNEITIAWKIEETLSIKEDD